jgi:hypothetical protein
MRISRATRALLIGSLAAVFVLALAGIPPAGATPLGTESSGDPSGAGQVPPPGLTVERTGADGAVRQVPVDQVTRDAPPSTLPERLRWEQAAKAERYAVDAGSLVDTDTAGTVRGATLVGPFLSYDAVTVDECDQHTFLDSERPYWHKNHYSSCYVAFDNFVKDESVNSFRLVLVGNGSINTTPSATVRQAFYTLRTSAGQKFGPDPLPDSTPITIRLECASVDDSHCDASGGGEFTKTLGEWRAGQTVGTTLTITGPAADPEDPSGRTYHIVALRVINPNPDYQPPEVQTPFEALRCDTESYNLQPGQPGARLRDNGACIFTNVDAFISFSRAPGSPVQAVAEHIHDAQTDVSLTKPGIPGTIIPGGRDSLRMLHRLVPILSAANQTRYEANRKTAVATCVEFWGPQYTYDPDTGTARDCDEYPFASTEEGAAYNKYNGGGTIIRWSARPIDRSQNRSGGAALVNWYATDHILENDGFWVETQP